MKKRSVGTHGGTFHADEVTAIGLLLVFDLVDRNKIVRSRDVKELEKCEYWVDVGAFYDPNKKRFDHHQSDYQGDLASAGMITLYLKDQKIISEKFYDVLNRALIWGVDAHDNGKVTIEPGVCTFSQVVTNFVPPDYEAADRVVREAFEHALDFVVGHLKRLWERFEYIEKCREMVAKAMQSQSKVLIFDRPFPWMDLFFDMGGEEHPAQFVVMQSGGQWKLRGIPPNLKDRMKVRRPLPEKWAGLMGDELKKVTGIDGAIFCHKGRFISVWETKEDVLKALDVIWKKK